MFQHASESGVWPHAKRYATAIAAVAITVSLKLAVDGLGEDHPFVLLSAPVVIAAWYGGRGPGLFAVTLVSIAGLLFLGPTAIKQSEDLVGLAAVAGQGLLMVWITVGLREARLKAEESAVAVDEARRELRFAVAVRDEVLRVWTGTMRGPLAHVETSANDALLGLEREGYRGPASTALLAVVEDAGMLRRLTSGWSERGISPREEDVSG
jgi:hypothetical protein